MSGDLGVMDSAGNLRIDGRLKDLTICGGHNINPAQIEALALRNTAVKKVDCFPVRDDRLGERVCIGAIDDAASGELLNHLAKEGLSRFDMPEYFVRLEPFRSPPAARS